MLSKPAVTSVPLHELLAERWSPRAFDPQARIAPEALASLLEAARWAPSCFNDQPWRFLVWDRHERPAEWSRAFDCLSESNRRWVARAPVLMLSVASNRFAHNGADNRYAHYDTGAATLALVLQAWSLGIAAHQMGGYDQDAARRAFAIPDDHTPMAMIALGRPAGPEILEGDLQERERAARQRRPLGDSVHRDRWGG
jgi:nitroreductase